MATYDAKRLRQMRKDGRLPALTTPRPCLHCEWCRFTLSLLGAAYLSLCRQTR